MRYILYARKSSESEDRQIQSIADQLRVLREFAQAREIQIVEEITESRSAKAPGERPGFEQLLNAIRKGRADGILCWSINRLTRNPVDSGTISWMLQNGELKVIQTPEKQYLPTDNVLILSVETGTANQFIIDLKRNVKRGMEGKVRAGWFPHRAPEGYVNDRNTRTIVPDGDNFLMVQRGWRLLLTGTHSIGQVYQLLNKEWGFQTRTSTGPDGTVRGGKPLSRSACYRIYTNIFYAGYFRQNGQVHAGSHTPMISLAEFETVQKRLRSEGGQSRYGRHNFPYRGLIRCAGCGRQVTAERQAGQAKRGEWVYYRCKGSLATACSRSIREDVLEKKLEACLSRITISPEFKVVIKDALEEWILKELGEQHATYENQLKALSESQSMLNELLDLRLKGLITDAVYTAKTKDLHDKSNAARLAVGRMDERLQNTRRIIEKALDFRSTAEVDFLTGDSEKRREIATALKLKYVYNAGEVYIELNPLLELLDPSRTGEIEPVRTHSESTKKTFARAKVPVGSPNGTLIEPLAAWRQLFRQVWEGQVSFPAV
jgi:DNA invertase Pin-like site-specific DNA recombinase